jgi:hypothetical protein
MALKDAVELGQSILALLRNAALAVLIISVVVWPSQIASLLRGLGIQEFELFGLKGKTALVDLEQQLRDQQTVNRELERQLTQTAELLKTVQAGRFPPAAPGGTAPGPPPGPAPSPAPAPPPPPRPNDTPPVRPDPASAAGDQTGRLEQSLTRSIDQAYQVLARADTTRQATQLTLDIVAPAVAVAQSAVSAGGLWGIVFSADTTAEAADPELGSVRALNLGVPRLYLRQKWYRGVLTFPTQAEAQVRLAAVRALGSTFKDAYVVNVATWCPGSVKKSDSLWDCQG